MSTVIGRVRAGATFMDVNCVGWPEKIDADRLDLGSCDDCVFGQAFDRNYENVCLNLGLTLEQRVALGFTSGALLDHTHATYMALSPKAKAVIRDQVSAEYRQLTAAWLTEIADRLATPAAEEARIEASEPDLSLMGSPL